MQIKVSNLNYIYNPKSPFAVKALDDISLTVNDGEFFGIVGHTGSGKSTFVQHLNGLIKIQKESGNIEIGEFNLADKKCDFTALRAKIGMLFQYPEQQLFADTVEKDVAFGLKNFFKLSEEETKTRVKEAVETVGLNYEEVKDLSPFELSGGQKRRVAIAGVIVTKPEILILDEPVAGLDPVGKNDMLELLKKLREKFVKTVVFVTHDMNLVAENCTTVAVFDKGKIKYVLPPKQLFKNVDELKEIGLDVPVTAYLEHQLGLNLDTDYSVGDFVEKLAKQKL